MANATTPATFDTDVLKSDVPVLVDFWATWCGPCRAIAPALENLSTKFAGKAKIVKVDVDSESEVAEKYGIMSIPALLVFKNGEVVDRMVGAAPEAQLGALIERNL